SAIQALLCSPDFLFLREDPGPLSDHALANRLSYALLRSAPDAPLRALADKGMLQGNPRTLLREADRLLRHPHSSRFTADFLDSWLNLRDIEFTTPDSILFPEFDPYLQWSMIEETRSFFERLLREDLPVETIVRSDFAMVNDRLARHYELPTIQGPELRPVSLPTSSPRGGFLSQGSILKISANGTNTSPILRGVWVMERILGQIPSPPPPGIPGVEPDIRGAETLRQLLEKHRNSESCQGCHNQIDPPGFALESFNPIGGWRDQYRSLGNGEKVNLLIKGRNVRYRLGLPVDASGTFANGSPFDDFLSFRNQLAQDPEQLSYALATKFLIFLTGRELGFSDRPEISRIVKQSAKGGYGVRSLLKLCITSEIFQTK
ncbi:MAG: DUF1592 domain-containing protein, partial [Verrucomicrobiota bacterium]